METSDILTNTVLVIVTACFESVSGGSQRGSGSRPPEAPSPRRLNISRDISTSDSDYPPSRYEDLKEATLRSSTTFINPREAPRLKDETDVGLPTIARPITGMYGVGGLPVQGALFPPPRAATMDTATAAGSGVARKLETSGTQKKSMFSRSASTAGRQGGKLVIGNPILQANDPQNPLNKIPVMDLKEAAEAERERRNKMHRESDMFAMRPAPEVPTVSAEEGLKRAVSMKRKEVQSVASQPGAFPASLMPQSAGMTTSAQLSPAADEVRRRSPRHLDIPLTLDGSLQTSAINSFPRPGSLLPEQAAHSLTTAPSPAPAAAPKMPMPNMGIRPSRTLPSPKASPEPEPILGPLQRRPTVGLPSNPRSRGMNIDQQASAAAQQTVLFVNNITYNNPETVRSIIKGANDWKKAAPVPDSPASPATPRSVVNRPRPIPRKVADPQPSPSPSHRRSKSGGSFSRKSILTSMPGSPTTLPPLPDLPKSAGAVLRPQPNDTKSMTFDEKMTMFFPTPPDGKQAKRRSSVPDLPRIPISYLDAASSPTDTEHNRMSNRTTMKTESIFDVAEITDMQERARRPSVADEVGTSWIPGISTEADNNQQMRASQRSQGSVSVAGKRASSPVIPPMPPPPPASTGSSEVRTMDDMTTNWGSVHSPELAVPVSVARKIAQSKTIQKPERVGFGAAKRVMPRPGDASKQAMANKPKAKRQEPPKPELPQWHHRVGDECPTFSARKENTRSRKVPCPTPLLLNGSNNKKPIYVQTEPSPVESPEHVLQQIQEQLKKFEEPARDSVDNRNALQRLELLENLEKEMGLQEDHWQEMKHDLGRDSLSSVQTSSPGTKSNRADSITVPIFHEPAGKSSMAERRASRRAQMRLSNTSRRTSTQSNDNAQLSTWQKRLTEAQMEYMDTAAKMLRDRSSNYLTTSVSMSQLGSPTPPESDQSSDDDTVESPHQARKIAAVMSQAVTMPNTKAKAGLWTPAPEKRSGPTRLLWQPAAKSTPEPEVELPSLSVHSVPRIELAPLPIHSTQLWRKPHAGIKRADGGLWRPVWASAAPPVDPSLLSSQGSSSDGQSQKAPRPLTQRPPRRNKRVTLLPDILESPQPLPDKRGTLGIFQFPWGEKSDTASVQPTGTTRLMAMPGTMASGGPSISIEARSRQIESAEYSSSFFDDYDDEEDQAQNSDDEEGDGSDDGFDETTLWEIASLLKSDNVPSKNSMFPPESSSVISDYMDELASNGESREHSIMIGLAEESREHFFNQSPPVAVESTSTIWEMEDEQAARPLQPRMMKATKPVSLGLWQHPEHSDDEYSSEGMFMLDSNRSEFRTTRQEPAAKVMDRKPRAVTLQPLEKLSSTNLWTTDSVPKKIQHDWTGPKTQATKVIKAKTAKIPRPAATEADWMAALNEAILASYPYSKDARNIVFSSADHVRRSRPLYVAPHFDSATRHPVFAASSLVTKSEWFHPAATGYTYDTAIVNPVFFGSLAITCPLESVHPAMSAYAAKKLRRQRSKRDGSSSPVSRSNSSSSTSWKDRDRAALTRSDSNRMKRKEEIRAQLRALEQSTTSPPPPAPAPAPVDNDMYFMPSTDPMIQAQIEALEEERLFVERAAKEEYRRRTSMYTEEVPEEAEQQIPSVPTIEHLQRHLSTQVRESLVLGPYAYEASTSPSSSASHSHSHSNSQSTTSSSLSPISSTTSSPHHHHSKPPATLWTSPPSTTPPPTWTVQSPTHPSSTQGNEDTEARRRRERGRKHIQKQNRRNEILAQIAAIEAGVDPRAEYYSQGMWSLMGGDVAKGKGQGKNWLKEVNTASGGHRRGTSRVMLRY